MPIDPDTLPDDPLRRLEAVMRTLLGPKGCPWDKEQDHRSLRTTLLEETYEVLQVIDAPGPIEDHRLAEELGDLLLQIVFHAALADERGAFSLDDLALTVTDKLIRRHPHVFGSTEVADTSEVLENWERIKKDEGKTSSLDGLPPALPALLRASTLLARAVRTGFAWPDDEGAIAKIEEEKKEFVAALRSRDRADIDHEFGDLVFALITAAAVHGTEPEAAVREAADRFENRFRRLETIIASRGEELSAMTPEELLSAWDQTREPGAAQLPSGPSVSQDSDRS